MYSQSIETINIVCTLPMKRLEMATISAYCSREDNPKHARSVFVINCHEKLTKVVVEVKEVGHH